MNKHFGIIFKKVDKSLANTWYFDLLTKKLLTEDRYILRLTEFMNYVFSIMNFLEVIKLSPRVTITSKQIYHIFGMKI